MSLIVETGAVVAGADAYVDLAFAATYHTDRGNSAWEGASDLQREIAIRQATQYLDYNYLPRWKGATLRALQERHWPRVGVILNTVGRNSRANEYLDCGLNIGLLPSNIIPNAIKLATCELALRALSGPLAADLARGGRVKSKKVGPLTTEYFDNAPSRDVYTMVDLLVAPFCESPGSSQLVRA